MPEPPAVSAALGHLTFPATADTLRSHPTSTISSLSTPYNGRRTCSFATSKPESRSVFRSRPQASSARGGIVGGISSDGRFVVVRTRGDGDILRYDRDSDVDAHLDEVDGTAVILVEADRWVGLPAISGDGGTIAYSTPTAIKVWRPAAGVVSVLPRIVNTSARISLNASGNVLAFETRDVYDASDVNADDDVYRIEITGGAPVAATVAVSAAASTPPAASEIPITNISPQLVRSANFDVSSAPGGGVKRAPGGGVKRAPGGGVKRAPGGGVKRAPGGGVEASRRTRQLRHGVQPRAGHRLDAALGGAHRRRLGIAASSEPARSAPADRSHSIRCSAHHAAGLELEDLDLTNTPLANLSAAAYALGGTPLVGLSLRTSRPRSRGARAYNN